MGCDEQFDTPKKYLVEGGAEPHVDTIVFPPEQLGQLQSTLRPVTHFANPVEEKAQEPLQYTRPSLTMFESDLRQLLNKHSMENMSGTPDFILAEYLHACFDAFSVATRRREQWYGRKVFGQ